MKVLLTIYLFLFSSLALSSEEEIECGGSGNGTHLVYSNGVGWPRQMARDNIENHIWRNAVDHSLIDPKSKVHWHSAYNHSISFKWDMVEALSQFLVNNEIYEERDAYFIAFTTAFDLATKQEWEALKLKNPLYEDTFYDTYLIFKSSRVEDFEARLESDTQELVKHVAEQLIKGDRVIAIADSQGTFFLNEMYRRLERGELPSTTENLGDFDFEDQQRFLASVHTAAATGPINPINRTVLNSNDIIRFISIPANGEVKAQVTFIEPIGITLPDGSSDIDGLDYRTLSERRRNHSLSETYLNTEGSPYSALQNLRQFTIDSIHEAAALLPLPCVYCVSEEFPDGQLGSETADFGFVADTATVTGNVLLRDGVEICGESVIEVLDENLLIMDRSTLWDVKMSISGIVQYGESWIVDSKLSNLEIRDTSTIGKFGSRASIVDGGIIVNDGTDPNTDGRPAEVYQSTLTDVNVFNSQIWRSTLSNLSIEKSVIDSIFIDAGSGVNASTIYDSYVVNSHVANSTIERSSIVNSDIIENSMISDSGITGDTTRTLIRNSTVRNSGVTDSTLTNQTIVLYSSVNGSSLSGSHVSDCLVNGVNSSGYNCINGEIQPW